MGSIAESTTPEIGSHPWSTRTVFAQLIGRLRGAEICCPYQSYRRLGET
jgi:hypothetical protein